MDTGFQITSVAIILGAPLANSSGLIQFAPLENTVLRLALVLLVLASTRLSPLTSLLTLLAVFSLFMERNFTVLSSLPNQQPHFPDSRQGIPVKANSLPAIKESLTYSDHDTEGIAIAETHGNDGATTEKYFEEATDLQDSNPRLPDAPTGSQAASFFEGKNLA